MKEIRCKMPFMGKVCNGLLLKCNGNIDIEVSCKKCKSIVAVKGNNQILVKSKK
ncbi:MAG: hypothetical protein H6552_00430 [Chitinophagales bacterium]|nr:hypothetical protein [Chitinophagales bacterium]